MVHCRFQVITAITWRIIAELFRRHHKNCSLRVFELHPGGGQYNCLSVFSGVDGFPGRHLCDFNQQSQHLHVWGTYLKPRLSLQDLRWPDCNDYVAAYLACSDPKEIIDQIEALLGLPSSTAKKLPSTTPPVLMLRVIAGILERFILRRELLDIRCGCYESSGMEGSGIRKELYEFRSAAVQLPASTGDWRLMAKLASRFWLLSVVSREHGSSKLKGLMDLRGSVYFADAPVERIDLWEEYEVHGRNILPVINKLEDILTKS